MPEVALNGEQLYVVQSVPEIIKLLAWNIKSLNLNEVRSHKVCIYCKDLIFLHFQGLRFMNSWVGCKLVSSKTLDKWQSLLDPDNLSHHPFIPLIMIRPVKWCNFLWHFIKNHKIQFQLINLESNIPGRNLMLLFLLLTEAANT